MAERHKSEPRYPRSRWPILSCLNSSLLILGISCSLFCKDLVAQTVFQTPTWQRLQQGQGGADDNAAATGSASNRSTSNRDQDLSPPSNSSLAPAASKATVSPRTESRPKPIVTRQRAFGVPFSVNSESAPIREVQLLVSTNQGRQWQLYGRQIPTAQEFPFRANTDGEYWFAVKTVGSSIKERDPKPELIITIDSVRPTLDVKLKTNAEGQIVVSFQATDPNLRPDSLKIEYQSVTGWGQRNSGWQSVELPQPDPQASSILRDEVAFRPQTSNLALNLRFSISDAAGNVTIVKRRLNLPRTALQARRPNFVLNRATRTQARPETGQNRPPAIAGSRPPGVDPYSLVGQSEKDDAANSIGMNAGFDASANAASSEIREGWHVLGNSKYAHTSPSAARSPSGPTNDFGRTANGEDPVPGNVSDPNFRPPTGFASSSRNVDEPFPEETTSRIDRIPDGQYAKLSNSRRFELDYQVDQIRPEDISKLQIWMTEDGGNTWSLHSVDSDRQSPVAVEVDDDGVYGFRIRIQTLDGLESAEPVKGDPADVWVEVDTTKPAIELTSIPYGRHRDAGKLIINWRATDQRLATRPITLYYSVNLDGPWQVMVDKLPNTGQFKWPVTDRVPKKVFIRVEVIDAAGNRNMHQTDQPIDLSGLNPRGVIRSVRPLD